MSIPTATAVSYTHLDVYKRQVYGLIGAILHIINHAFMKSTLFLTIGGIQYRYGETNIDRFGRLYSKMPVTALAMVIAAMSMIGLPPTGGFFSK